VPILGAVGGLARSPCGARPLVPWLAPCCALQARCLLPPTAGLPAPQLLLQFGESLPLGSSLQPLLCCALCLADLSALSFHPMNPPGSAAVGLSSLPQQGCAQPVSPKPICSGLSSAPRAFGGVWAHRKHLHCLSGDASLLCPSLLLRLLYLFLIVRLEAPFHPFSLLFLFSPLAIPGRDFFFSSLPAKVLPFCWIFLSSFALFLLSLLVPPTSSLLFPSPCHLLRASPPVAPPASPLLPGCLGSAEEGAAAPGQGDAPQRCSLCPKPGCLAMVSAPRVCPWRGLSWQVGTPGRTRLTLPSPTVIGFCLFTPFFWSGEKLLAKESTFFLLTGSSCLSFL